LLRAGGENLHEFRTAQTRPLSQLAQGLLDRSAGMDHQPENRRGPLGPGVTFLPALGPGRRAAGRPCRVCAAGASSSGDHVKFCRRPSSHGVGQPSRESAGYTTEATS
jgi:hypothetical protein